MVTATDTTTEATSGPQPFSFTINPAPAITDSSPLPRGDLTNAYSYSFGTSSPVSGGTPPFTWSQTGGGLPPGLQFSSAGVLAGTPTNTGLFGFTITVTDSTGATGSKTFGMIVGTLPLTVTVLQQPPASSLTVAYPPAGAPAQPYFSASNGTGIYTWSATGLPPGVGMANPSTPVLSGTPTQAGSFNATVKATDNLGGSDSKTVTIVINPAPSITTTSLAACTAGTFCTRTVSVTGGTGTLNWQVTSGNPPGGMGLSGGVVSGTPGSVSGPTTSNFTATATDAVGASGSQALSIIVNPAIAITTGSPLPPTTSGQSYSQSIAATGGTGALTWSGQGLPNWLTIDSNTGALTGTAPSVATPTTYPPFSVQAQDINGASASKNFSVTVNPLPTISPSTLMPWTAGQPYTAPLTAGGGTTPFQFADAATPPSLPNWLSLNGSTLSGTPPLPGGVTYPFSIRITDSTGANSTQAYSLTINQPPTVLPIAPVTITSGTLYSQPLSASNGTSPLQWFGVNLPQWLAPSGASLTGTAPFVTTSTNYTFGAKVVDAAGASDTGSISVTVVPVPVILTVTPNIGQQGETLASVAVVGQGTNFVNGTTVANFGAGITVNSTTVTDATHATVSISISLGIVSGARTVTMTTGSEVAPLVNGFTVVPAGTPILQTVTPNSGQQGQTLTSVALVGVSTNFVNGTTVANFGAGITVNSTTVTDATHATMSISIALGIASGPRTVTMTTGNEVASLVNGFTVVAAGTPILQTVTPNSGQQGQTLTSVAVVGVSTKFVNGATVANFGAGITVNSTTVSDGQHATVSISIAANAVAGARTVTLTTGNEVDSLTNGFTVVATGTPVLQSVTPNTGQQGQTLTSVALVGVSTNFVNGATVANFGAGITVNSTTVTDATHATVSISIAANAAAGARTVTLTTSNEVDSLTNGFTVVAAGTPVLQSVTPNTGQQGQTLTSVAVVGVSTNFVNGTTVANFGAGITVNSTSVTDATHATVSISIAANAAAGARTVTLTTSNEVDSLTNGFTVVATGTPVIQSVTPNTGQQGQTLTSVAVVGGSTNFVNGATVANFGAGITVNSTTVTDATHATVSISIAANAAAGARTVTLTTSNEVDSLTNGFTVVGTTPVIQSVTPNTALQGQSLASVAIVGLATNFVNGTTVANFGAGITVNSTTVTDATHATASITLAANAAAGARAVTLTTGTEVDSLAGGFTVTANSNTPAILTVTPNAGLPGQTLANLSVVGQFTNFVNGTTTASFGAGITVNSVTVGDAAHATVSITIAPDATAGSRTVTLVTGNQVASLPAGFVVTMNGVPPSIQAVFPSSGQPGQSVAGVTIVGMGTNFIDGITAADFGSGITVNSISVTDATHAAVNLTIAADAIAGARTVTVTTGSEVVTATNAFLVITNTGAPTILTVTPNVGQQEQTLTNVEVTGEFTNFSAGSTVANFGPGVTVNATTVTDTTHATVSLTIAASAAPGARTVTMRTGLEDAVLIAGFAVEPAVTITNPAVLPPWTEGRPYSVTLHATGGTSPYTFSDPSTSLPAWLILNGSTLSGTPPSPGGTTYTFNLQAADEVGAEITKTFTLLINKQPVVSPTVLAATTSGVGYSASLTTAGGTAPFTWSATGTPAWLALSGGNLTGIAPSVITATLFGLQVMVTDVAGATAQADVVGTINPPVSLAATVLPQATSGSNYSTGLVATGGTAPLTFAVVSGSLPSGLTLSAGGLLSGVPAAVTQPTNFQFQVTAIDNVGSSDTKTFQVTVVPQALTISTSTLASGTAGAAYSITFGASGGEPPYTWSVNGVLPTGLHLDPAAGVLSGTPTEGGSFPLAVSVTDKQGNEAAKGFTLAITSNLKISSPAQLTHGSAGATYSLTLETTGSSGSVTWSITQGALADGTSLGTASGTISGVPTLVGTFNARVRAQDATGAAASEAVSLVIDAASLPAATITGLGTIVQPAQQTPIGLTLSSGFPLDITGQLTVAFTPDPSVGVTDPMIQFAGGNLVTFRIPANTTQAIFDQSSTLQTGSLSGTITLNATFQAGGAAASAASISGTSGTVPVGPPVIVGTPTATVSAGSIQISLTGLSTTRQVTSAIYHFSFTTASNQAPVDITVPLGTLVSGWYSTPASLNYGSLFGFTQNFTVNGNVSQVTSVSITLTNNQGTSPAVNVSF